MNFPPRHLLTRIVTIYEQWDYLHHWIDEDALFNDPSVAWIVCNDAPHSPCPPGLCAAICARGASLLTPAFNLGRSEARNLGARAASSLWLEFIDGDDVPLPIDLDWLRSAPRDRLVHYPHRTYALIDEKVNPMSTLEPPNPFFWQIGLIRRLPVINCRPSCLIFPTEAFHAIGGFDGRYDTCEDLHLIWKFDRTAIGVTEGPAPKQLYRATGGERCDPEVIGFYTHRLLRMGARQTGDLSDVIHTQADAQALRGIRALHTELTKHYNASISRHVDTLRDVSDLFWRARDTFLREYRPGFTLRFREALKILFRH